MLLLIEFAIVGWGLLGALLIVAFTSETHDDRQTQGGAAEEGEYQANRRTIERLDPNFVAVVNAIKDEARANRHEQSKEEKAKSNRERVSIFVIFMTFVVLSMTLVAVVLQIDEMKRVYKPIRDQARAAVRQATIAERQAKTILANLRLDTLQIVPQFISQPEPQKPILGGWIINPVWTNVGGTDAKNTLGWWSISTPDSGPFKEAEMPGLQCPASNAPSGQNNTAIVAPQAHIIQGAAFLSIQAARNAIGESAKTIIFISGIMNYEDIFGDKHNITWCRVLIPNDIDESIFSPITIREIER